MEVVLVGVSADGRGAGGVVLVGVSALEVVLVEVVLSKCIGGGVDGGCADRTGGADWFCCGEYCRAVCGTGIEEDFFK